MPKTTADVPPVVAADYKKIPRPNAVAVAEEDGYAKTLPMQKVQQPGKQSKQYGLPRSSKLVKPPGSGLPKSGKGIKSVKM